MKPTLSIPQPCNENFAAMPRCGHSSFCAVCQKGVTDLSHKNLAEVKTFLTENPQACIRVKTRHTDQRRRVRWINSLEVFLHRFKMPAFSSLIIGVLLLVSGCHHRKPQGRTMGVPRYLKQQQIISPDNGKD